MDQGICGFPTRLSHDAFPGGFPTGLSHVPPWCESILGLTVEAVQGKQVSLEWTETSGGLWECCTTLESSPLPDASSLRVPGPLSVVCEEPQLHGAAKTHSCRFSLSVYPVLRRPAHSARGRASSSLACSSPGPGPCFWDSSCSFGPYRLGVPLPEEFRREEWVGYSLKFGLPRPGWPAGEVPGPQTCCLLWLEMALEDAVGSFR